jgi:hypothetical protein
MIKKLMKLEYSLLLIMSKGKKSFSEAGRTVRASCSTVTRSLIPATIIFKMLEKIAVYLFKNDKKIFISIDDTLIKKPFSKWIVGAGRFFDTRAGKKIMGLKLLVVLISNGKYSIPINACFLFAKEVDIDKTQNKSTLGTSMLEQAVNLFPEKHAIITADGAFATLEFFKWIYKTIHKAVLRMHRNRSVIYKGKKVRIDEIKELIPVGRQMARTISVTWHDIPLYITAHRRIDKNGEESIVFLAANYKAKPSEYVAHYKMRWFSETFNRTAKQSLGLGDCYSTAMDAQINHVAHVLLSYAFAQFERKRYKLPNPEAAIKASKLKKYHAARIAFSSFTRIFDDAYA